MRKKLAIITARGGSKRIPRKNIRTFCGKPILSYSIEAARDAQIFDEIMVSTDDEEIRDIALGYGAKVPFMRSTKNSDDYATTGDVLKEVLENYSSLQKKFDDFCCIYPTAPFVTGEKIANSYRLLNNSHTNTVVSVVPFSFPVQRAICEKEGYGEMMYPEYLSSRSQDLEVAYHDAGQFYWAKVSAFLENPQFIGNTSALYILDELEVQDIDNENDWKIAELKYQLWRGKQNGN